MISLSIAGILLNLIGFILANAYTDNSEQFKWYKLLVLLIPFSIVVIVIIELVKESFY